MDDYSRYLSALQASSFADQTPDLILQQKEQKEEAITPLGEMLTTGGVGHLASSAFGALKNMAIEKGKELAKTAMKKAGVSDEDSEQILKGNFDTVAKQKVQDAITKAKSVAEDIKGKVTDAVDEVKAKVSDTVDEVKATAQDTMDEVKATAQSAMDEAQTTVDGITSKIGQLDTVDPGSLADDLANEGSQKLSDLSEGILSKFSKPIQPDSEFGNELLQEPRMIEQSGGIRPQPTEAPVEEDGVEMSDLSGIANQAQTMTENATSTISDMASQAQTMASETASNLSDFADSALSQATTTVADSIAPAVSDAIGSASTALTGIASSITESASGITSAVSSAVSGLTGATAGATAGEAIAGIGETVGATVLESVSSFLGPLGIFAAIGGGIASLVEGLEPHSLPPVLNPSAQFL